MKYDLESHLEKNDIQLILKLKNSSRKYHPIIPKNPKNLVKALYNVFIMRHYDNFMRRRKGQEWIDWKNEQAIIRTNKTL